MQPRAQGGDWGRRCLLASAPGSLDPGPGARPSLTSSCSFHRWSLKRPFYPPLFPQALAEDIASRDERESSRISEERKKRNYSDFWVPAAVTEPFRVVLSHMRDKLYTTREVWG